MENPRAIVGHAGAGPEMPPVEQLVPHRGPMLLLDEVRRGDAKGIECRVLLRPDSPFVEAGRVRAAVAVEYMAQCVAAWVGLQGHARGEPVRIGYLVGAREVAFAVDEFRVGDELRIEATRVWGDDTLGHFECKVSRDGATVATGGLNVYRGPLP
jgi:predicted hotdog family 3-hydroxylacyl-ACP dehydratase